MNSRCTWLMAVTTILGCAAMPVCAVEDAKETTPNYDEASLTGDWNGLRNDWYQKGVAVDLGYTWDMLHVKRGGLRSGGRPIQHFDLMLTGDLDKTMGWKGANAVVNFIYDSGGKTNRDHLGSLLGASNVEVPVSTSRLYQAWVEQTLFDDSVGVLLGLYPIDTEFQTVESADVFVQPPYGAAPEIALTRGPSIFNNASLGLRIKWQSQAAGVYAMGAVLDGIPGDPNQPRGTHVRFQSGDGTMQIAEFGYQPSVAALGEAAPEETFAKYAIGLWRYTAKVNDWVDVDTGGNPELRRSSGWYALAERTLWRWNAGSVAGFFRWGATDGNSTAIQQFYNTGLRVRGLIPGRDNDVFGLAHTHAGISDKFRASQATADIHATSVESSTEMTYRFQVRKWLYAQPVIQRFHHPGADSAVPNATVVGVRMEMVL